MQAIGIGLVGTYWVGYLVALFVMPWYGPQAAGRLYGDPDRAMPGFVTKWHAS